MTALAIAPSSNPTETLASNCEQLAPEWMLQGGEFEGEGHECVSVRWASSDFAPVLVKEEAQQLGKSVPCAIFVPEISVFKGNFLVHEAQTSNAEAMGSGSTEEVDVASGVRVVANMGACPPLVMSPDGLNYTRKLLMPKASRAV
jgi:hypothetical protein